MSEVRIDENALAAEADAVALELSPASAAAPLSGLDASAPAVGPSPDDVLAGYKVISFALVSRGFEVLAPAWQVTHEESTRIADATAVALQMWFPDQPIPPKYLALLVVAGSVMEVVDARRDPQTGQLKPAKHAKPSKASSSTTPAAA